MGDGYNIAELNAALADTPFAGRLHHFATIHSTNAYALEQAQADAPSGSVYFADEQTSGRGRGGHAWHSEPNAGLYVSVLLRPRLSPSAALLLSLATGLAVRDAIAEVCGLTADIRWPNDILLEGKKCCGILVETAVSGDASAAGEPATQTGTAMGRPPATGPAEVHLLRHVVIGIGLNVNHAAFPPELSSLATSLRLVTGYEWPRQPLLVELLRALHHETQLLQPEAGDAGGASALLKRFSRASTWVSGKHVHVQEAGGYTGVTDGLDRRGFLRVRSADGMRTVLSGGVRELPPEI